MNKLLEVFIPIAADKFSKLQDPDGSYSNNIILSIVRYMGKNLEIDKLLSPLIEAAADKFKDNQNVNFMRVFMDLNVILETSDITAGFQQFIKLASERFKESSNEHFISKTIAYLIRSKSATDEDYLLAYAPFIAAAAVKFNDLQKLSDISTIVKLCFLK